SHCETSFCNLTPTLENGAVAVNASGVAGVLDIMRTDANGKSRSADAQRDVPNDRKFITALARGLDVLSVFRPDDRLLGNQEIAARTGLPKPTVSRLTYTLTKLGYLTHVERF